MTFLLMLVGAALGAFLCAGVFDEPTGWTAAVLGGCVGLLLGQLRTLRLRLAGLENTLGDLRARVSQRSEPPPEAARDTPVPAPKSKPISAATPAPAPALPEPVIAKHDAPALVVPERAPPAAIIPSMPHSPSCTSNLATTGNHRWPRSAHVRRFWAFPPIRRLPHQRIATGRPGCCGWCLSVPQP